MNGTCEVIGWLVDDRGARMMVRDESGTTSVENVRIKGDFKSSAIQTGTFRRKPIIDRATQQCVGYEMERVGEEFEWC